MTHHVGAQLTALSIPGQGNMLGPYFAPYGAGPGYWYNSGPTFREPFRPYGRVFFGAEDPSALPQRRGLTATLAPIVAPATGGVLVRKTLDENQVLHVEICVDGMCHSTSMDLAPAIQMLLGKLKTVHDQWHASQAPEAVNKTVNDTVNAAEELIVGALVDKHVDTVASGILSSITDAVSSIVSNATPVGWALKIKPIGDVIRKFKGPIAAAAGIAAAGAATAIPGAGPFVAPLAGKLAGDVVNSTLGDKKAQQEVAQAKQQAQTDPVIAAALNAATKAVANTTAAYHVKDTAQKANAGDPAAQQEIAQVAVDAKSGDPAAQAVSSLIQSAMTSEWGAKLWEGITGRGPDVISPSAPPTAAGWYNLTVGQDIAHPSLVSVLDENGRATGRQVMWHPTHDQIAQFGGSLPAYYTESGGGFFVYTTVQGPVPYRPTWQVMYWNEGQAMPRATGTSTGYMGPAQAQAVIGQWREIIGAAIDATREQARAHATTKPGNAAGVILTADGRAMGRGFRTLDAAIDWLQHITRNHHSFTYAAAYEKDRAGNAFIQAEEFGTAAQAQPMQAAHVRAAQAQQVALK
jgi:hypothetical protein